MKGQDLVLLLKLGTLKNPHEVKMTELAHDMNLSQSEISKSFKRLEESGLLDAKERRPHNKPLMDLIEYGVRYFFPTKPGRLVRGIPTSHSAPPLSKAMIYDSTYVWESAKGKSKGEAIEPLYQGVVFAAQNDNKLYELLALVDAVRVGRSREHRLAIKELRKRILND